MYIYILIVDLCRPNSPNCFKCSNTTSLQEQDTGLGLEKYQSSHPLERMMSSFHDRLIGGLYLPAPPLPYLFNLSKGGCTIKHRQSAEKHQDTVITSSCKWCEATCRSQRAHSAASILSPSLLTSLITSILHMRFTSKTKPSMYRTGCVWRALCAA